MAYKLLLIVFNGSGSKVVGFSRKGRPWTPIPIRSFKSLTRWVSIPFPTITPGGHGGWSKSNERYLAKIQSVAFDLVILYGLRPYKKHSAVQVRCGSDRRVRQLPINSIMWLTFSDRLRFVRRMVQKRVVQYILRRSRELRISA